MLLCYYWLWIRNKPKVKTCLYSEEKKIGVTEQSEMDHLAI